MRWTQEDPGVGDPGMLHGVARVRGALAAELDLVVVRLDALATQLPDAWQGTAGAAHLGQYPLMRTDLDALASSYRAQQAAIETYATALDRIQAAAAPVVSGIHGLEEELPRLRLIRRNLNVPIPTPREFSEVLVAALDPWDAYTIADYGYALRLDQQIREYQAELGRLLAVRGGIVEDRRAADAAATSALGSRAAVGALTADTIRDSRTWDRDELMRQLSTMTASERALLLAQHPELFALLTADNDDPDNMLAVAAVWGSIGPAGGALLARTYPQLVGNLEGAAYRDRASANTTMITAERSALKDYVRQHPDDQDAVERLKAIDAILTTLGTGTGTPPRSLISLDLGDPVLAAISFGDVDTADITSFLVPGMNTTAASMPDWGGSALDFYNEQQLVMREAGLTGTIATIAWIGYETPTELTVKDADLAIAGAARLAQALDGFNAATLFTNQGAQLNVFAHSYGSTTAMYTLKEDHGVDTFAAFGSAGWIVDDRVLHGDDGSGDPFYVVGDGGFWYTDSPLDFVNDVGVGLSQFSSNPRLMPDVLPGAQEFDSGGGGGFDISYHHGDYLRVGTEALRNMAILAAGRPDLLIE